MITAAEILSEMKQKENPEAIQGMARFGINPQENLGISIKELRQMAKDIGKNHHLAQDLWQTRIRDARILAALIEDPQQVTEHQLETWVKDINSWDLCDLCCGSLFDKTIFVHQKIREWSKREEEFVKRAAFSLIAWYAVHEKKEKDETFEEFLVIIKRESHDSRNYVKKAVNWALRSIGKRNSSLNKKAIQTSEEIQQLNTKTGQWIANDALRELTSQNIQKRLKHQKKTLTKIKKNFIKGITF